MYYFSRKLIWFVRYLVSVPVILGSLVALGLFGKGLIITLGVHLTVALIVVLILVVYPMLMLTLFRMLGLIKDR
jgi:hypothetical protein